MASRLTRIDRRRLGLAGIALTVVLFLAVNMLAGTWLTSTRLDLTQDHLFTLSTGTKDVLASIQEPIDLRLYYTKQLDELGPYFSGHAKRVEELLATYQRLSHGKVRLERLDPAPFSPEEDLAVAEGLEGLPVKDDGTLAYFGLTGRNSTDDTQAIRYLAPERANFLEYDLTRMIADLANPKKPVVAVLGDLPLVGTQFNRYQPWKILDAMYQVFDVRFLGGKQDKIDDDVQVLMLAQPHNVDPATLYAIDQFVMRGGRVLAFVDPLAEVMAAGGGMNPMENAEGDAVKAMEPLLASWGVTIPDGKVIGDRAAAQRVSARIGGRQIVVDYLPWLALGQDQLAANDVVTGQLKRLHLNSVGSIEARAGATTTIEPLVVSSPLAEEIDVDKIKTEPDPTKLLAEFKAAGKPFTLAARVTGPVKTAFPKGPPEGVKTDVPQLKEAKQPLNLILVADADLLADATWVRSQSLLGQDVDIPIANNGDFAVNALDNLAGTQGLISLRGRGLTDRPFEVVKAMERDASDKFQAKEQELQTKIDATQKKIRSLQDEEQQSGVILTAAQQQEVETFRGDMIKLREELRGVQRQLRENVEHLSTWVKIINIWAVPVLIALIALGVAVYRRLRIGRGKRRGRLIGHRMPGSIADAVMITDEGARTMSPKIFLGLLVITVITSAAAVVTAYRQPAATPVRYGDEPAFPGAARESGRGRQDRADHARGLLQPGARDRRPVVGGGALRLHGRQQARARPGRGARRHAPDRGQDQDARPLRPDPGRGRQGQGRQIASAPPRERRRQGPGGGADRQGASPADRHRARGHLPAPAGRGAGLAGERRHPDRAEGGRLAGQAGGRSRCRQCPPGRDPARWQPALCRDASGRGRRARFRGPGRGREAEEGRQSRPAGRRLRRRHLRRRQAAQGPQLAERAPDRDRHDLRWRRADGPAGQDRRPALGDLRCPRGRSRDVRQWRRAGGRRPGRRGARDQGRGWQDDRGRRRGRGRDGCRSGRRGGRDGRPRLRPARTSRAS